jgi:hypothetical protein
MLVNAAIDDAPGLLRDVERDLDALLVEHCVCAPAFLDWLLTVATGDPLGPRGAQASPVRKGPRSDNGADVALTLEGDGGATLVLLSNRLNPKAPLARACRAEADAAVASGRAAAAATVLIRPGALAERCREADACFDCVIEHERVLALLEERRADATGENARRLDHHAALFRRALETARRVAEATPPPDAEDFLDGYLEILAAVAPDLPPGVGMRARRPGGDTPMMVFAPEALPDWPFLPQTRLAHHLREGVASVLLYGWGARLAEVAHVMEPALARTPFRLAVQPGRRQAARAGLLIVADTRPVDPARSIARQRDAVAVAIARVDLLRRWFAGHRAAARYWADAAGHADGLEPAARVRRDLTLD